MYPEAFDNLIIENRAEFDALSPETQVAYCLHRLEAEVNNGGFHQFFSNSSGAYARETKAALESIGAEKNSELFSRAIQCCFPAGYPKNANEHEKFLVDIDEVENEVNSLDREFYQYVEPLDAMVNEYLERSRSAEG